MDTTPEYILMSGNAEEIQSNWKPEIGRYFNSSMGGVCIYTGRLHTSGWTFEIISENDIEGRQIWLPRQDELQEKLSVTHMLCAKISMFHDFYEPEFSCPGEDDEPDTKPCKKCQELGVQRRTTFTTMEQLWLGFIMSEKYHKVWNGKDWIKR